MEEFLSMMAEILEEDAVKASDVLDDFDGWDSLAMLSVIASADSTYHISLSAGELKKLGTVQDIYDLIERKRQG